jgi:hypothetical protein
MARPRVLTPECRGFAGTATRAASGPQQLIPTKATTRMDWRTLRGPAWLRGSSSPYGPAAQSDIGRQKLLVTFLSHEPTGVLF